MKTALYLVLKSTEDAFHTLELLREDGYNGTLINTESIRHAVDTLPEEHNFYTLRHFEKAEYLASIFCIFVVENDRVEPLKKIIRESTDNFKRIKGFMYTYELKDYEGTI